MDRLLIVPAEDAHLDKIAEIEAACFSTPWSRQSFADSLANGQIISGFTALYDGEVAGYIILFHLFEEGELLNIAVSPRLRNMGIGNSLMDKMSEYLKSRDVTRITLEVRESNESAKKLYLKKGFSPIGIRKNYYTFPIENAIVMEKHI